MWVIDSVNFPEDIRSLAHLAHELFSDPLLQNRRTPVLVACNKQGKGEGYETIPYTSK